MPILTIQCPSGDTCYADECISCHFCMHMDEFEPPELEALQSQPDDAREYQLSGGRNQ